MGWQNARWCPPLNRSMSQREQEEHRAEPGRGPPGGVDTHDAEEQPGRERDEDERHQLGRPDRVDRVAQEPVERPEPVRDVAVSSSAFVRSSWKTPRPGSRRIQYSCSRASVWYVVSPKMIPVLGPERRSRTRRRREARLRATGRRFRRAAVPNGPLGCGLSYATPTIGAFSGGKGNRCPESSSLCRPTGPSTRSRRPSPTSRPASQTRSSWSTTRAPTTPSRSRESSASASSSTPRTGATAATRRPATSRRSRTAPTSSSSSTRTTSTTPRPCRS